MKLRERIEEIKIEKGIYHYAKEGVERFVIDPYKKLDKEIMAKGVKVEILAEYVFFDIRVGSKRSCHDRMSDPEDAIAEMKAYLDYFEKEGYKTEKVEENGITGFFVIL